MSTREYHTFMSMHAMLAAQSSASSSFTSGASIHFRSRGFSRVDTCTRKRGIHSGMCVGASF